VVPTIFVKKLYHRQAPTVGFVNLVMDIAEIQAICLKLKGITEDIKWENHLCFNIGGKMFLVTAPDSFPVSASIKVSDDDFLELPTKKGIIPAPYMARHKWVFLEDINIWTKKQWEHYIGNAYHLVGSRLPAKKRKEYGFEEAVGKPKAVQKPSKKKS
jgi:predicted DNA-binding protein (MmcQ/YjbR family)